jgi:EmrB/QacA subfamily drug resistance transporter
MSAGDNGQFPVATAVSRGRYGWALAVVAVGAFMITMDNTVVANALPTMIRDLGLSTTTKDWVATGYILTFSCLMIAGGRLTDVYGCRVVFTAGMAIFTGASAVCGLAPDDLVLVLGRIVQGSGAALALPATLVMVTVGRTDRQRSLGTIVWVGAASVATALGPTIGGIIVSRWDWGWIFLINVPAGVLVILLGLAVLTPRRAETGKSIDLPGALVSAVMLFATVYGLESGRTQGWGDPSVLVIFGLAVAALACFVLVENRSADPMIDLKFLRNRVFAGGALSQMLWGIGFNGMVFYAASFLQRYLGFSPPEAGLVMLPSAVAVMVVTPLSFWVAGRLGPRAAVGGGMAAMAGGLVLFSALRRGDGFLELMPGLIIVGAGAALCMPLAMYVLKAVPDDQAGVAGGVLSVIREVSGAFGIAILGLLIDHVPSEGADTATLETFRSGTASGLVLGAALVLVGSAISATTLPSKNGWLGPKHGRRRDGQTERIPSPPHLWPLPSLSMSWEGPAAATSKNRKAVLSKSVPSKAVPKPAYTSPPRYPARPHADEPPAEFPLVSVVSVEETALAEGVPAYTRPPRYPAHAQKAQEQEEEPPARIYGPWPLPPQGWYRPYTPDEARSPEEAG